LEKRLLRRIFGPGRDDVTEGWRNLYNEEFYTLYSSPDIIRMIKSRRMRWIICLMFRLSQIARKETTLTLCQCNTHRGGVDGKLDVDARWT
jgi:hypothetical protein